jgi:predicted metal-dependent hydrolase
MEADPATYEPRYLAGILFFNRQDFFEAHEVWESLWQDCCGPERRFYQGLIQAAVGLHHFANGNLRGAAKLYRSSRDYMDRFGSPYLGLDTTEFWRQMGHCFAELLAAPDPDRHLRPRPERMPQITLEPAPATWPDPAEFLEPDD